jgi:hypothetical protein
MGSFEETDELWRATQNPAPRRRRCKTIVRYLVSPELVPVLRKDVEGISDLCQKRRKLLRLSAAKNTAERMGNFVPIEDLPLSPICLIKPDWRLRSCGISA